MSLRRKTREQEATPQIKPETKPLTRAQQRRAAAAEAEQPQMAKRILRSGRSVDLPTPPVAQAERNESRSSTPTQDEQEDLEHSEEASEGLVVLDSWSPSTGQNEEEAAIITPEPEKTSADTEAAAAAADIHSEEVQLVSHSAALPLAEITSKASEPFKPIPPPAASSAGPPLHLPEPVAQTMPDIPPGKQPELVLPLEPPPDPKRPSRPPEPDAIQPEPSIVPPQIPESAPPPPLPEGPPSHPSDEASAAEEPEVLDQTKPHESAEADMDLENCAGTPLMDEAEEDPRPKPESGEVSVDKDEISLSQRTDKTGKPGCCRYCSQFIGLIAAFRTL